MNNIIFLDLNGVLTIHPKYDAKDLKFNLNCVNTLLDAINQITNVKIVISSAWRKSSFFNFKNKIKKQIPNNFNQFIEKLHPDWRTPELINKPRGIEIDFWLKNHPDVIKYICIDDSRTEYLTIQPLLPTLRQYGFTNDEKELMIMYFNNDKNNLIKENINKKIKILKNQQSFIDKYIS